MNLSNYSTLIFDCDGVLLDSNFKKSEAYRMAALDYGASPSEAASLVDYHITNTGISRYVKFEYFIKHILKEEYSRNNFTKLVELLNKHVMKILKDCDVASGLIELKAQASKQNWMVMSGGDQDEVRQVLSEKKIDHLFNYGIYGSPDSKDEIISQHLAENKQFFPAIFFGDSKYDIEIAKKYKLDFIFIYGWTDYSDWKNKVNEENIKSVKSIGDLVIK